jgi:hypothetical protein
MVQRVFAVGVGMTEFVEPPLVTPDRRESAR